MVAAGRAGANSSAPAALAVALAVAPLLLLAGVARADCFDYCFKNCIANDKSMRDYCNYACDKTCDGDARPQPRPLGADMGCQLSCAKASCSRLGPDCRAVEACFGRCYDDGCRTTKTLPRPLRAGAGPIFPSSEPEPDDAAPEKKHHPFHNQEDAVWPSSEPDPDGGLNRYFHEKQDAVQPASEPDPDDTLPPSGRSGMGGRTPLSEIHAAPPAPV